MELNQPLSPTRNPESNSSTQAAPVRPFASSSQPPLASPRDHVYRSIQSYPFHSDPSYQSGLSTILGHPTTPASPSELTDNPDLILQAQCFYFARKHGLEPIDITEYKNFLAITSTLQNQAHSQSLIPRDDGATPPLERPDPVPRPSAPTPNTALTASTIPTQGLTPTPQTISPAPTPAPATNPSDPTPPYPTSFADIVELITQNKPIPGIEKIPETVLDPGSSRQDHTAKRRKPWEKSTADDTQVTTSDSGNIVEGADGDKEKLDIETPKQTGEGVVRILQPGAIPDSGLLAKE